jgi:hypothetical protein
MTNELETADLGITSSVLETWQTTDTATLEVAIAGYASLSWIFVCRSVRVRSVREERAVLPVSAAAAGRGGINGQGEG